MINENLDIDSKMVEDLFDWYTKKQLIVNRRYQRKLVWSISEKRALVSSIIEQYPIPLLLFVKIDDKREILDGMQRLEAIMSFIEQKFDFEGMYFDLEATAFTKLLKDTKQLEQRSPILPREQSVKFSRYKFAISEFSSSAASIDEVFRRINSNGKTLSKQELRSAGCVSNFSEVVRKIATQIRGDTSHRDILNLNSMSNISIDNEGLGYGVSIDNHFYVNNGILTRTSIRESIDEELIAHMLGYLGLEDKPTSGSEQLDGFYGIKDTTHTSEQRRLLETFIQTTGEEVLVENFIYVYDALKSLFEENALRFKDHILGESSSHESPRYFQAVFLAFYELLINQDMEIKDDLSLLSKLKGCGDSVIKVSDGGRWASSKRQESVEDLVAIISKHFKPSPEKAENHAWVTEIDNILTSSKTEQTYYDFKQGFCRLDGSGKFHNQTLEGILATTVGINNIGQDSEGFILVGIADKKSDAERISSLFGTTYIEKNDYYITGVDHEAISMFGSLDAYFGAVKDKIRDGYSLTEELKQQLLKNIRLCKYKDRHLLKIVVKPLGKVANLDKKYYLRQATSTTKLESFEEIEALITNFASGR